MVELNQRYRVKPAFSRAKDGLGMPMVGTVVYIHPKERYAVLEFEGPAGKARECFFLEDLTDKNRVLRKKHH